MPAKKSISRSPCPVETDNAIGLCQVSDDILCKIMKNLSIRDIACLTMVSKRLNNAVEHHLHLRRTIDFTAGETYGYFPSKLEDIQMLALLSKCTNLQYIYGLNPMRIERRCLRVGSSKLSISGVISALRCCRNLIGVETSHLLLMEAVMKNLPQVRLTGHCRNENGQSAILSNTKFRLQPGAFITSLHLTGVDMPGIPDLPHIQYLYLQWVQFTQDNPFSNFQSPSLETFVLRHCWSQRNMSNHVPMMQALASASNLRRLEFVNVAFLGRFIQQAVTDFWRNGCFTKLEKIACGACSRMTETDLGFLLLVAAKSVKELYLQPSLSHDSLFASLLAAQAQFSQLTCLYLGFVDDFPRKGTLQEEDIVNFGMADVIELPAPLSDMGIKLAGQQFPNLSMLNLYNCPHLVHPLDWSLDENQVSWKALCDLTICRCNCIQLEEFEEFISSLPSLEILLLEDVFLEPPKGCSHVGLSAGTGLGMSSAIVSNQQEQVAVHGQVVEEMAGDAPVQEEIVGEEQMVWSHNSVENINEMRETKHKHMEDELGPYAKSNTVCASHTDNDLVDKSVTSVVSGVEYDSVNSAVDLSDPKPGSSQASCQFVQSDKVLNISLKPHKRSRQVTKESNKACNIQKADEENTSDVRHCLEAGYSCSKNKDSTCQATADDIKREMHLANAASQTRVPQLRPRKWRKPAVNARGVRYLEGNAYRFVRGNRLVVRTRGQGEFVAGTQLPSVADKSISTSDPLLEDDSLQIVKLSCEKLRSLTLISVGVSDVVIHRCPQLVHLHVEACASLKHIRLRRCPLLNQISITQCPKLNLDSIARDIARLQELSLCNLFVQPYLAFDQAGLEATVFQKASFAHGIIIVIDHGVTRDDRYTQRQMISSWIHLFLSMNRTIIEQERASEATNTPVSRTSVFPWGRNVFWLQGRFVDGPFEIITDIPWLHELWFKNLFVSMRHHAEDSDLKTHQVDQNLVEETLKCIEDSVAEVCCMQSKLPLRFLMFYVHLGDVIHRRNVMQATTQSESQRNSA